jgi:hypothetical protein
LTADDANLKTFLPDIKDEDIPVVLELLRRRVSYEPSLMTRLRDELADGWECFVDVLFFVGRGLPGALLIYAAYRCLSALEAIIARSFGGLL